MLECDEVERMLSDYEDGALPFSKMVAIRFHLMMCRRCPALERSLRETIDVLRAMRDEPIHEGVDPEDDKDE